MNPDETICFNKQEARIIHTLLIKLTEDGVKDKLITDMLNRLSYKGF